MVGSFIHDTGWSNLPQPVRHQAVRCLLDTLGAAVAGRQTDSSRIIYDFAAGAFAGRGSRLWLDGRHVSPAGAALAHGMTIDSIDVHDGYNLAKGHIGVSIIPAVLATLHMARSVPGLELLTSLVIGYEVAGRAGRALHATVDDYHTSGAWNALGASAVVARRLKLTDDQTRHALGIAEYHGPRSQMMRCIDHPSMVKDGSGWGALVGVSAALLAQAGFSGAPAVTVESADVADYWTDLGDHWLIMDQYFKPYAVCRWAQPAIAGALLLLERYQLRVEAIKAIQIETFHEAVRLAGRHPQTTEEAQYSICFPVAAMLLHGRLGASELTGAALQDPLVLRLSDCIELIEHAGYNALFPAKRFARVKVEMDQGAVYDSGPIESIWGADDPPSDAALSEKFRWLIAGLLPESRASQLEQTIWDCADLPDAAALNQLLAAGP
jgi:2-methylcitrate dehydratase PrpD